MSIMFLPIPKSCYKLLRIIYTNRGVKISKLLQLARVSQKIGYAHLDSLLSTVLLKKSSMMVLGLSYLILLAGQGN